jgi:hypothetical protein
MQGLWMSASSVFGYLQIACKGKFPKYPARAIRSAALSASATFVGGIFANCRHHVAFALFCLLVNFGAMFE